MELDINVLIRIVDDLSTNLKENGDNISPQEILVKIGEIENILQAYEELEKSHLCINCKYLIYIDDDLDEGYCELKDHEICHISLPKFCDCWSKIDPIIQEKIDEEREKIFYIEK